MATVGFRNVQKTYGGKVKVIHGIGFDIADGEFVVLVGPSGCGKSTLLRMLAGLEDISGGEILIDGKVVNELESKDRDIAMVFQSYALYPHMTVRENMAFSLRLRNAEQKLTDERVAKAAKILNLDQLLDRHPRELSGGQRQRVALARALVIEPPVLLLDEPLSNLDAKLREEMQFELRQIQRKVGTTTVMVTHDQTEAMSISDRVVVMEAGRVTQIDQPHRLYEHPQTRFISNFVGKANLLEGRVAAAGPWATVNVGGNVPIEVEAAGVSQGDAVVLSLRPEKIRLVHEAQGRIGGTVKERFFLGSQWLYQVSTAAGQLAVVCPNDGTAPAEEGANVGLDWAAQQVRLLPGAQGVPA